MKTVGNDLVRHQLHENRKKWYLGLGILLVLFGFVLWPLCLLPPYPWCLSFGVLMMIGGVLHFIAAFKILRVASSWLWALFGVLYLVAGYYAFSHTCENSHCFDQCFSGFLIIAGVIRIFNAILFRAFQGWGWTLFFWCFNSAGRHLILTTPDAPFWVLGLFLAFDILFQGLII